MPTSFFALSLLAGDLGTVHNRLRPCSQLRLPLRSPCSQLRSRIESQFPSSLSELALRSSEDVDRFYYISLEFEIIAATSLFKMLLKYRPEDKAAKKERLLNKAQADAAGKEAATAAKKLIVVKMLMMLTQLSWLYGFLHSARVHGSGQFPGVHSDVANSISNLALEVELVSVKKGLHESLMKQDELQAYMMLRKLQNSGWEELCLLVVVTLMLSTILYSE
ncbi:hypothetical protein V2J09_016682 [Rumex salicifolius]